MIEKIVIVCTVLGLIPVMYFIKDRYFYKVHEICIGCFVKSHSIENSIICQKIIIYDIFSFLN